MLLRNTTRSAVIPATLTQDNFYELNNKMLPNAKLVRAKRGARGYVDRPRPRKLGRRRPSFLPPRLPPIARRRFPKRPSKSSYLPIPPHGPHGPPPPNSQYGPPVGFFVMNINNEIVHKSKDLGGIPPRYLDKIIPPNFISDSPPKIYALEHDEGPPLGLGESQEVPYTPTNSYGQPVPAQQLDPQQYYPYPPAPTVESNNVPLPSETRAQTHNQINAYNRGQSETLYQDQEQPPPLVYHPPYHKKKHKKKKRKQQQQPPPPHQHHTEFALQPDSTKNSYPVSSYDAPLSYVPAEKSPTQPHYPQALPPAPQKVRPAYNVGQSYVESYSREASHEEREPPQLPAKYNQNDFSTVNKSNNKKKVVYQVNTSYEDFSDTDQEDDEDDHGLALEYPPSSGEEITEVPSFNFGARHKKKKRRPQKFDFIDSYEDSSISQEVYHHTTPYASSTRVFKKAPTHPPPPPPSTTSTTTRPHRTRSTTQDPLFDILDTDDLRNAFQSGRHRYKLQNAHKNKEPQNFVLLSSKNTPSGTSFQRSTPKMPFVQTSSDESGEGYKVQSSSSLETDYESYEIAERDFGLRKRDFSHKRKGPARKEGPAPRMDSSVEKIQFADGRRVDDYVRATTMKPYARFNPDVQFTKTFSSKIEQPRESSIWNGQAIPGNHKITKRGGGGGGGSG